MYGRILIATDGSELAEKAINHGIGLAKAVGAKVTVVRVTNQPAPLVYEGVVVALPVEEIRAEIAKRVQEQFAAIMTRGDAAGVEVNAVQIDNDFPWHAILETAKTESAELIVMASHGRRGLSAVLLGSETQKVLTHSTIPVLVCR